MKHKYKMNDLCCDVCVKKGTIDCIYSLCPYIMDNLSDLFADGNFRKAVIDAENCKTHHKNTLKHLKKQALKRGSDLFNEEKPFRCGYKMDCESCNYASPGFICYSENDGTCLKDWIRSKSHAGR